MKSAAVVVQQRDVYTKDTASTRDQVETEQECVPFFANLAQLPPSQISHLRETGLLHRQQDANENEQPFDVWLLRDKHEAYLHTIWDATLRPSFVTLESSRPWLIYWCLHGLDLLGRWPKSQDAASSDTMTRTVETLRRCFTHCNVTLSRSVVNDDFILSRLTPENESAAEASNSNSTVTLAAGGFGGGPDQLPHAATTYAAVLALIILAGTTTTTSNAATDSLSSDENNAALDLLKEIRLALYPWLVSLHDENTGSYRMHADGEIDVRATYCVVAVARLLGLLPIDHNGDHSSDSLPCTLVQRTALYVASCQTWEGGFAGEPGAEAHGGYTYCAVAALELLDALSPTPLPASSAAAAAAAAAVDGASVTTNVHVDHDAVALVDLRALTAWLARRQMSFEGGFSGRANKLVDGCYSFWQGSAMAIVSRHLRSTIPTPWTSSRVVPPPYCHEDPWLASSNIYTAGSVGSSCQLNSLFDPAMLERYIVRCTQDTNGGLRDKPSKGRDFYHSCYCLSGLSIAQHFGGMATNDPTTPLDETPTRVHATHPCFNIRMERVEFILDHVQSKPLIDQIRKELR
jgi:protein farnesyltransferase subunit beta